MGVVVSYSRSMLFVQEEFGLNKVGLGECV